MLRHPNQVFTKDMIYECVWGNSVAVDDNAIMVYINRLRSKIEEDRQKPRHILTVRGLGVPVRPIAYALDVNASGCRRVPQTFFARLSRAPLVKLYKNTPYKPCSSNGKLETLTDCKVFRGRC